MTERNPNDSVIYFRGDNILEIRRHSASHVDTAIVYSSLSQVVPQCTEHLVLCPEPCEYSIRYGIITTPFLSMAQPVETENAIGSSQPMEQHTLPPPTVAAHRQESRASSRCFEFPAMVLLLSPRAVSSSLVSLVFKY